MKYGMAYEGSKNKIAEWVIDNLPESDVLIDAFGGGGAITHCACLSGKYKTVVYNELNHLVYDTFRKAVNGEYRNENRWISREQFHMLKDIDGYVALCFSFGNDMQSYAYSKDIEQAKMLIHQMICSDTQKERRLAWRKLNRYLQENEIDLQKLTPMENLERVERLAKLETMQHLINLDRFQSLEKLQRLKQLQSLENLERLQSLERLDRLQSLEGLDQGSLIMINKSYDQIDIPEGAVVYCDIPYKDTGQDYQSGFNHDAFYEWALNNKNTIVVSEYDMPSDFYLIAEKDHTTTKSAYGENGKVVERLYSNKDIRPKQATQLSLF